MLCDHLCGDPTLYASFLGTGCYELCGFRKRTNYKKRFELVSSSKAVPFLPRFQPSNTSLAASSTIGLSSAGVVGTCEFSCEDTDAPECVIEDT